MSKLPTPEHLAYMQEHIDDNRQALLYGTNIAFLIIAFGSVAMRFMARSKIGTHLGLDDWLILCASMCVLGHVTCLLVTTSKNNMGRHIILMEDAKTFTIVTLTAQTFYNLSIPFAKLSILCLYNRIFRRTSAWFMPTLWISAAFVVLSAIPPVFVYILQCTPLHGLWEPLAPGEVLKCVNFKAAIIAFGVINIFSDIYILLLPIPVVLGLQLEKRTKISVCSLFLVGGIVCIISIVRLMYAKNVETVDPTWDFVPIAILSTLEASAAVMVACMPTWRPLFRVFGRGINAYFNSRKSGSDSGNLHYAPNLTIGSRWKKKSRGLSTTDHEHSTTSGKPRGLPFILGQKRSSTSMSGDSVEKMLHKEDIELEPSSKLSPSLAGTDQTAWSTSPGSLRATTPTPASAPVPPRAPTPVVFPNPAASTSTHSHSHHAKESFSSKPPARGPPPRSVPDPTFSNVSADYAYQASAGADRWESLMKQQQIKNKAREEKKAKRNSGEKHHKDKSAKKARYGEVAYGGAAGTRADGEAESEGRLNGGMGLGLGGISVTKTVVNVSSEG